MKYRVCLFLLLLMTSACVRRPVSLQTEVMLPYTPVKNQGASQTCWIYAMLAAIETEHIGRGDSVHLSVAFLEQMMERDTPTSRNYILGFRLCL
jgi:bleomycin hydrolase